MTRFKVKGVFTLLISSYITIIFVTLAVLAISLPLLFQSFYIHSEQRKLIEAGYRLAQLVSVSLDDGSLEALSSAVGIADSLIDGHIFVTDRTGLVLTDTDGAQADVGLRLTPRDVQVILGGKAVARSGSVSGFDEPMTFVAVPIRYTGETIGALLIYSPLSGVSAVVAGVRRQTLFAAAIAISLSFILGYKLSTSLARPLQEMSHAAAEMAKGRFRTKIRATGAQEVVKLGDALSNLASELAQTLSTLKWEKSRTESILSSMAEGVVAVDSALRLISANPTARSMLPELPQVGEVIESSARVHVVAKSVLESGEMEERELPIGSNGVASAHFSAIIDELGIVLGAVGVMQDISQRKRLEQLQRDFVANVSHELRTPLTGIQGFAEAIKDGVVDGEAQTRRVAAEIADETKRLARLVADLLDLERMESGYLRLDLTPTSMVELVTAVIRRMKGRAAEAHQIIVFKSEVYTDAVFAESDRIEQVLDNLITNAINYSRGCNPGTITVSLSDEGEFLTCSVSDMGVGISADDLQSIWLRFRRGTADGESIQGTGLGLAIVKQIIELHGGRVCVESRRGWGSTFAFTLPRVAQPLPTDR